MNFIHARRRGSSRSPITSVISATCSCHEPCARTAKLTISAANSAIHLPNFIFRRFSVLGRFSVFLCFRSIFRFAGRGPHPGVPLHGRGPKLRGGLPRPAACRRKRPLPCGTLLPHAGAKGPCPTERPLRLPAQKARAPRNSPPHAGAKGPCSAERPTAACRQSDIRQRGKRFRPLRSPLPTKITIYRVKKGRRRIFSPRRPKPGQHRSPKTRPKARAEVPSPVRNPPASPLAQPPRKSCQKRAILPTDAIGKKRRDFHRPKASTTGLLTKYARKKTV